MDVNRFLRSLHKKAVSCIGPVLLLVFLPWVHSDTEYTVSTQNCLHHWHYKKKTASFLLIITLFSGPIMAKPAKAHVTDIISAGHSLQTEDRPPISLALRSLDIRGRNSEIFSVYIRTKQNIFLFFVDIQAFILHNISVKSGLAAYRAAPSEL